MTSQEQLTQLEKAIHSILIGAQEYTHEGRRVRRAELSVLYEQRRQLAAQIAGENGEGTSVAVFEGR